MSAPIPQVARATARTSLLATLITSILGSPAHSEAPAPSPSASDATELEEVLVTARKREERVLDVPQSIDVISGAALESTGVATVEQLQYRIPGLSAVTGPANQIAIRGISNNASQRGGGPSTAVHLDGVYLPRPEFAMLEAFDLDRIEVLKGPEGTLYGRNATSGVLNYITRSPGDASGFDGFIGTGSNSQLHAQVGATIHFADGQGLRISAVKNRDDGYTRNLNPAGGRIDGRDYQALRMKGAFDLSSSLHLSVTAEAVEDHGTVGYGISENPLANNFVNSLDPPQRTDARHIQLDSPPWVRRRGQLLGLHFTAKLPNDLTLESITGYVNYRSRNEYDSDSTGGFIETVGNADSSEFWSQEFQLSGSAGSAISWTSGLYFSQERTNGNTLYLDSNFYPVDLTPFIFSQFDFNARSQSAAAFGELTYRLNDQWSLLAGARYTRERVHGTSEGADIDFSTFELVPFTGRDAVTSSRFTPKLSLQYKPGNDTLVYASVTSGFKSGGVNFYRPVRTYKPERVTAYEVGAKSKLAGSGLELNGAVFYYDYRDLQLRTVVGNTVPISNVARAPVKGAEIGIATSSQAPISFDLGAAYTHTELKDYVSPATGTDLSGMPLPLSPKFSGTFGVEFRLPLGRSRLSGRAELNHQGRIIFPALQAPDLERRDSVTLLNAHVKFTFADERSYLTVLGRNLTDKTYLTNRSYSAGFTDVETYGAPRTYEVRIGTSF